MLTLIDEYTRECLAIRVARRLGSYEVEESRKTFARTGIRSQGTAEVVAGQSGYGHALYRARKPLGERLLRKLQWQAEGSVPEWRDLLFAEGSADRDREVAGGIQHEATTPGARL